MANSNDLSDLSDLDLDMDFNMGPDPDGDSRNPVMAVGVDALSQFGTWENMTDIAGSILKGALPGEYGAAFSSIDNVARESKNVFEDTIAKLEPGVNAAKKLTNNLIPKVENFLPVGMTKQLREFAKDNRNTQTAPEVNPNDLAVITAIKDVFGAEQTSDKAAEVKEGIEKKLDRTIRKKEFTTNLTVQSDIAMGISRLVGFQDGILNRYYRKSLELQHRHFFVARDAFVHQKATTVEMKTLLQGILTNSGLPNEVKVRKSEVFWNENAKRLVGTVNEGLGSLAGRIRGGIQQNINEFSSGFNELSAGLADGQEQAADGGMGITDMAAGGAAGLLNTVARNTFGGRASQFISDKYKGTALGNLLATFGKKLSGAEGNSSRWMNELMHNSVSGNTNSGGNDTWWKEFLGDKLVGLTGGPVYGVRDSNTTDLKSRQTEPATWDFLSRQTLVQIIPGYQARQLEMLTLIATGVKNDGEEFDINSEKFVSKSQKDKDLKKKLEANVSESYLKQQMDSMFKLMDPDSRLSLTDEEKRKIAMKLTQDSLDGRSFDIDKYTTAGSAGYNPYLAQMLRQNVDNRGMENTEEGTKRADKLKNLQSLFNDLTRGVGSFQGTINSEDKDSMRRIGLINDKNEINHDIKKSMIARAYGSTDPLAYNTELQSEVDTTGRFMGGGSSSGAGTDNTILSSIHDVGKESLVKFKEFRDIYKRKTNETNETLNNLLGVNTTHLDKFKEFRDIFKRKTNDLIGAVNGIGTSSSAQDSAAQLVLLNSGLNTLNTSITDLDSKSDSRLDFIGVAAETIDNSVQELNKNVNNGFTSILSHFTGIQNNNSDSEATLLFRSSTTSLLERIAVGVENIGTIYGLPDLHGITGRLRGYFDSKVDGVKGRYNSAKDSLTGALDGLYGSSASMFRRNTGKARGFIKRKLTQALGLKDSTLSSIFDNTIGRLTGSTADKNLTKVYLIDQLESPVMTLEKLQRGFYYDGATGTKITKWSDITGEVTTKNRQRIIITEEQFAEGLVDENNKPISSWVKRISSKYTKGKENLSSLWNMDKKAAVKTFASNIVGKISGSYTDANLEEVYVKGEYERPVMTLDKLKRGTYYSGVTGKKITKWSEIDGEVRTKRRKIVVSVEQFEKGLVDINGKPIKTIFNKAYNRLKSMYGIIQNPLDRISALATTTKNALLHPIDTAKKLTTGLGTKIWDTLSKPRGYISDLYLKGEGRFPILTSAKLKAGEYYDSITKMRLKSWSDIKNDIVDVHGNVVVSFKDFYQNLIDTRGKNVVTGLSKVGSFIHKALTSPLSAVGRVFNFLTQAVPSDLFVNGVEGPKLFYHVLKSGGYFNEITKKPIRKWSECTVPILDSNGLVVLTKEDIDKGLYTKSGALGKVKSLFSDIPGKISTGFKTVKNLLKSPLQALGGMFNWGLDIAGGLGGKFKDFLTGDSKVVDVLKDIYSLLNYHILGKSQGHRFKVRNNITTSKGRFGRMTTLDNMATGRDRASAVIGEVSSNVGNKVSTVYSGIKDRASKLNSSRKEFDINGKVNGFKRRYNLGVLSDTDAVSPTVGTRLENMRSAFGKSYENSTAKVADKKNKLLARFKRKKGTNPTDEFDAILDLREETKNSATAIVNAIRSADDTPESNLREGSWQQITRDRGKNKKGLGSKIHALNNKVADKVTKPIAESSIGSILSLVAAIPAVVAAIPAIMSSVAAAVALVAPVVLPIVGIAVGLGMMKSAYDKVHDRRMKREAAEAKKNGTEVNKEEKEESKKGYLESLIPAYGVLKIGGRLYDKFKYSGKLQPLEMLRFLQYGLPVDNAHAVTTVRFLEDELYDDVEIDSSGKLKLDFKKNDLWERCYRKFGLVETSITDRKNFEAWIYLRFLPVFTRHKTVALRLGVDDLLDIDDDLASDKKFKFVTDTGFGKDSLYNGVDVYSVMTSPFRDIALVDNRSQIDILAQQIRDSSMRGKDASVKNTNTIKPSKPIVAPAGAAVKAKETEKIMAEKDRGDRNEAQKVTANTQGPSLYEQAVAATSRSFENVVNGYNNIVDGATKMYDKAVAWGAEKAAPAIADGFSAVADSISGKTNKNSSFDKKASIYLPRLMNDLGLTAIEAAGIIGNLGHESAGMKAGIQEKGQKSGRGGLGWAQWTGPRRRKFEAWLAANNMSATDDEANYQYLLTELRGEESAGVRKVKGAKDVHDAVYRFERGFERSGDVDKDTGRIIKPAHFQSRYDYADRAMKAYSNPGKIPDTNSAPTDSRNFLSALGTHIGGRSGGHSNGVRTKDCLNKYGDPRSRNNIMTWEIPKELHFKPFPTKIVCNKDLVGPLSNALKNVIDRNLTGQVKTWDGCHCIRMKRGGNTWSLHSWGIAFDINAATNGFGARPTMSSELVKCFTDAGFDWGGVWKKPDGMHFQLASLSGSSNVATAPTVSNILKSSNGSGETPRSNVVDFGPIKSDNVVSAPKSAVDNITSGPRKETTSVVRKFNLELGQDTEKRILSANKDNSTITNMDPLRQSDDLQIRNLLQGDYRNEDGSITKARSKQAFGNIKDLPIDASFGILNTKPVGEIYSGLKDDIDVPEKIEVKSPSHNANGILTRRDAGNLPDLDPSTLVRQDVINNVVKDRQMTPIVHVDAPDISSLTDTSERVGNVANLKRDEQLKALMSINDAITTLSAQVGQAINLLTKSNKDSANDSPVNNSVAVPIRSQESALPPQILRAPVSVAK